MRIEGMAVGGLDRNTMLIDTVHTDVHVVHIDREDDKNIVPHNHASFIGVSHPSLHLMSVIKVFVPHHHYYNYLLIRIHYLVIHTVVVMRSSLSIRPGMLSITSFLNCKQFTQCMSILLLPFYSLLILCVCCPLQFYYRVTYIPSYCISMCPYYTSFSPFSHRIVQLHRFSCGKSVNTMCVGT